MAGAPSLKRITLDRRCCLWPWSGEGNSVRNTSCNPTGDPGIYVCNNERLLLSRQGRNQRTRSNRGNDNGFSAVKNDRMTGTLHKYAYWHCGDEMLAGTLVRDSLDLAGSLSESHKELHRRAVRIMRRELRYLDLGVTHREIRHRVAEASGLMQEVAYRVQSDQAPELRRSLPPREQAGRSVASRYPGT